MKTSKLEKTISFRLKEETYNTLLRMAQECELDMSDFMRCIIDNLLEREAIV